MLKEAIHHLKFRGARRLARPLSDLLLTLPLPAADLVIPVPTTHRTLRERGFNQTLLLARELSRGRPLRLEMDVLRKVRETPPQLGLKAADRRMNLKKAFAVVKDIGGKRVVLLDDVMTTGATVRECSRTLIRAGAREVVIAALARAPLD
jgi:ComF family protein